MRKSYGKMKGETIMREAMREVKLHLPPPADYFTRSDEWCLCDRGDVPGAECCGRRERRQTSVAHGGRVI